MFRTIQLRGASTRQWKYMGRSWVSGSGDTNIIISRLLLQQGKAHLQHQVLQQQCLLKHVASNSPAPTIFSTRPFSCGKSVKLPEQGEKKTSWHGQTSLSENLDAQDIVPRRFGPFVTIKDMKGEVDFGILFDIDGVIARGSNPLSAAKKMVKLLVDDDNKLKVPISFVTNSCGVAAERAKLLSKWLNVDIVPEQVIQAQGPLSVFHQYHDKRILFVGQGKLQEIAKELGFTNIVLIDEVKDAFPLLDIVDHSNRRVIAAKGITSSTIRQKFEPIEAVILIGEPNKWETHLQLLVDLLLTGGYPAFAPTGGFPKEHVPVLACNMDLVFMAEACMPRFGHGAFLVCLESLYKKITGRELEYTALVGKPSEITLRYAEHCIADTAKQLGITGDIKTLYLIGDNPETDVYGANLYSQYIQDCVENENLGGPHSSRQVPNDYDFNEQTVNKCHSVLVETGVYDPKIGRIEDQGIEVFHHGHRDFDPNHKLKVPTIYSTDVYDAVMTIMEREVGISDECNNNNNEKV